MFVNFLPKIFPIVLVLVGLVHLIPARILFQPDFMEKLYQIQITDPATKIIILHRASFFLFLGIFMIVSAFFPMLYDSSFYVALLSMGSFVLIYLFIPSNNSAFSKVFKIDVILLILLGLSYILKFYAERFVGNS
jgi:hypothetical protein